MYKVLSLSDGILMNCCRASQVIFGIIKTLNKAKFRGCHFLASRPAVRYLKERLVKF